LLLGGVAGSAFEFVPSFPFGATDHVGKPGFFSALSPTLAVCSARKSLARWRYLGARSGFGIGHSGLNLVCRADMQLLG
jgi:hypothetical protein